MTPPKQICGRGEPGKGCGAEIYFIRTERGRAMPVETRIATVVTEAGATVRGYPPHWDRCPARETFRKKKAEEAEPIYPLSCAD